MSEYIVSFSCFGHDIGLTEPDTFRGWVEAKEFGEPIVRCRDCKWFEALSSNGFPVLDKRGKQIIRCEIEGFVLPDGNGFCAWGERKEEA